MRRTHVEIVSGAFAAAAEDRMDDVIDLLDEEIEMPGAVGGLEQGELIRGRAAVAEQMVPDLSVWAERSYELQEIVEAGDRVVAFVHERRRGRGSGVDIGADIAFIYSFKGLKISRIEPYLSQSDARKAAGLMPQTG